MNSPYWRSGFYLAGLVGLAIAIVTIERPSAGDLPSVAVLGLAGVFTTVSLLAAGLQWCALLETPAADRPKVLRGVFVSQLAKYLPAGGLVQVASQVSLSESESLAPGARFRRLLAGLVQLAAACPAVGLLLVWAGDAAGPRWAALALAPLMIAAHPRVMSLGLTMLSRLTRRPPDTVDAIPFAALARGQMLALTNIATLAAGFAVLVTAIDTEASTVAATGAFALAWLAGFVVVPLPAGLGVREAALVALLPDLSPGTVVVAAVALRLVGLGSEVLLAGLSSVGAARARV